MARIAALFPCQGSLTPDARARAEVVCPELVARVSELVHGDVFGRAAESTRYAQPATFLASTAGWVEQGLDATDLAACAGHSLGELSALAAAGAISPEVAVSLVVLRGELMGTAAETVGDGGMLALLGATIAEAEELAAEFGVVIANDNAPGQVVVSGERVRLNLLAVAARECGHKALLLDVAGAFHSPSPESAQRPFRRALEKVAWLSPTVHVISGVTAPPFVDFATELAAALVAPVRWREVMAYLHGLAVDDFIDVGPGSVLAKLAKRNLATPNDDVVAA